MNLLTNYSEIDKSLLKSAYLKEVYDEIQKHPLKDKIIKMANKPKKIYHLIAYQNPSINFLFFESSETDINKIMYENNALNRILSKRGLLKITEDRPQYDHLVTFG